MVAVVTAALSLSNPLVAQVITYEANVFPEDEAWARLVGESPGAERTLTDGWFVQAVDLPDGWPGPTGDADSYRMPLEAFAGTERFFAEWRAETDNPSSSRRPCT